MATLKLRNCTKFQLRYKIIILGASWHYVKPGEEGTDLHKPTIYTLRVEVTDEPGSSSIRAAAHPNGIYYAVYEGVHGGGKINILEESQAKNYSKDDNNPNITVWFPEPKIQKNIDGHIEWEVISSRTNLTDKTLHFEFEETLGFSEKVSDTHRLTIEKSQSAEFSIGASFKVDEVDISGSSTISGSTTKESIKEKLTENEIYGSHTTKLAYSLDKGESIAVWQPYINVLGYKIWLEHLEYRVVGTGQPDNINFEPAKLSLTYFPKKS